jgi:transglutaminase-like putative cysteine protease
MRYEIVHTTEYDYSESVAVSHHVARLRPRTLGEQTVIEHTLAITPRPAVTSAYDDYFGNGVTFFAMESQHRKLTVQARTTVSLNPPAIPNPSHTVSWEDAADLSRLPLEAAEFTFASGLSAPAAVRTYAASSFPPDRPVLEGVLDLTARIHAEFTFDPKATTVTTPLGEVLQSRRGVCQDFTRLEIACLRALGIPARYISGYLETLPPPGEPHLVGADASHAWLAVYCPEVGWVPVDPTNNLVPQGTHIVLGWGRDYNDVSPIRGVILGGGQHTLTVHVDVIRTQSEPHPTSERSADSVR